MFLKHEHILALSENLNDDDVRSEILVISNLNNVWLYTVISGKLLFLKRGGASSVRSCTKPATYRLFKVYLGTKPLPGTLKVYFSDHRLESNRAFIECLDTSISNTRATSNFLLQIFLKSFFQHNCDWVGKKWSSKFCPKFIRVAASEPCWTFYTTRNLEGRDGCDRESFLIRQKTLLESAERG